MKFEPLDLSNGTSNLTFTPFDRGLKGAFVWRESSTYVHTQRIVANTATDDTSSDRYSFQLNVPRVAEVEPGCCPTGNNIKGTDLVSVNIRFLADTAASDRISQLETMVSLLNEMKTAISIRERIYS